MSLKVLLATTADREHPLHQFVRSLIEQHTEQLKSRKNQRFTSAATAAEADIILFIEAPIHKFRDYAHHLLRQEVIREYPNRCFGYDWEDGPAGFLSGVYPSLPRRKMNPERFRPGGFLVAYNNILRPEPVTPHLLFSFRGSAGSHPLREKIFQAAFSDPEISVTKIDRWFNHADEDKLAYAREISASKFVLCPRGIGPSTFRLFETMAAGRVPVILSDDWVPPIGPAWGDFAVVVAEDRVTELPVIVRRYEPYWQEMGNAARHAWEQWYSPEVALERILQSIEEILLRRSADHDERAYHQHWLSGRFACENGWTLPQKVLAAVRHRNPLQRVRSRLAR